MGSTEFGPEGSLGAILGGDGTLGVVSTMLGWVNNLVKAVGYFVGGDFQEAFDAGFMA
ncbi:hypothetical protein [Dietzia lutea]|uniref:hypothetical protein n=1 Tax=Dietzia lutea TaxID=546160 RepID=UPI00142D47EA|nr:hypothetical protein [Dietzia lutea]